MIKLCKFNSFCEEIARNLDEKNIPYTIDECIWRCDLCQTGAFVQKDKEFISANSVKDLMDKILK